jgi:hypothetical protein
MYPPPSDMEEWGMIEDAKRKPNELFRTGLAICAKVKCDDVAKSGADAGIVSAVLPQPDTLIRLC